MFFCPLIPSLTPSGVQCYLVCIQCTYLGKVIQSHPLWKHGADCSLCSSGAANFTTTFSIYFYVWASPRWENGKDVLYQLQARHTERPYNALTINYIR